MYSNEFCLSFQKFRRLSSFLGVMPAEFSVKTCRITETIPTPRRTFLGIISYFCLIFFFFFRTSQLFLERKMKGKESVNNSQYAICTAHCFLFVLIFGAVLHLTWFKSDLLEALNRITCNAMEFQSKFY